MIDSNYTNLKYDKPEMYECFDNKLKEINEEYRTTIIILKILEENDKIIKND